MTRSNPVGWFEMYVDDMPRACRFYETVLGVKLQPLPMPSGMQTIVMMSFPMDNAASGASGALVHMEGMKAGGNSTIVYFSSKDCAIEAARVGGAGGKVHQEKMSIGAYGFIALALDTEGNMFGLHSMQ